MRPIAAPTVAVIMSTYAGDQLSWLREAVRSIRDQDYDKAGIHLYIARDGAVPEEIELVLQEEEQLGATIIRIARNQGLTHALNACLARLQDEAYVFRMDADDIATHDRIRKQVAFMEAHPEVDLLGGSIEEFDTTIGPLGIRTYPRATDVRSYICIASPLAHPTVCFRRSALNTLGPYPEAALNEDLEMWFRALRAGLVIDNLADVLLRFRVPRGLVARRGRAKALGEFRCYIHGILALHGATWRLIFPALRLITRLMPEPLIRAMYLPLPFRRRLLNSR